MRPSLIIPRLRAQCASFSNRVGGAADYAGAQLSEAELAVPHAFVIPVATTPIENQLLGGSVAQDVIDTFAVAICVLNTVDERGQDSAETMEGLIEEVVSALIGWTPSGNFGAVEWAATEYSDPDRARLWAQVTFQVASFAHS